MDRDQTITLLRSHMPELQRRFGVVRLALFGALARDRAGPESCAPSSSVTPSMSESAPQREWRFRVEDMLSFCTKVLAYNAGRDRDSFAVDSMRYDATLRNLELIGEAATHVPGPVQEASPKVPWRLVVAVRNRLIHG